jgi:hypothetical protein
MKRRRLLQSVHPEDSLGLDHPDDRKNLEEALRRVGPHKVLPVITLANFPDDDVTKPA